MIFLRLLAATVVLIAVTKSQAQTTKATPPSVENSVVKVFSTIRNPDVFRPWTKQAPNEISGSGVVIEGKRILTNAHVVLYSSQIQIQADQAGDKITATVEAIAPGIDLALLKLDDESFFDTHPPLVRAVDLPSVKEAVLVYGYPTGGSSLSITKGIVSRIEFTSYNYPVSGLRVQLDAAINPGNSGGPAVADDRMIGLAFSRLEGAENIGYIIPSEEIEIFLSKARSGSKYAKPGLFDLTQNLENSALRPYLHLAKTDTGVVILEPDSTDPAYPLKKWDLIAKIGPMPVDDQGMVHLGDLRLDFHYEVQRAAQDGKVEAEVVREGKHLQIEIPVVAGRRLLIPSLAGTYPRYFVYGPLVFTSATDEFASAFIVSPQAVANLLGAENAIVTRRADKPAFDGEEIVAVSSPFFPHPLAEGYVNPIGHILKEVNGIKIRSLRHLVDTLRAAKGEYIVFAFEGHGEETLVFPRSRMLEVTDEILGDNGIREQGSKDLLDAWASH